MYYIKNKRKINALTICKRTVATARKITVGETVFPQVQPLSSLQLSLSRVIEMKAKTTNENTSIKKYKRDGIKAKNG